jgi:hypothetical protein
MLAEQPSRLLQLQVMVVGHRTVSLGAFRAGPRHRVSLPPPPINGHHSEVSASTDGGKVVFVSRAGTFPREVLGLDGAVVMLDRVHDLVCRGGVGQRGAGDAPGGGGQHTGRW